MDKIWANRLVAGTKTWAEMPASRRAGVKRELTKRVTEGEITAERYKEITGRNTMVKLLELLEKLVRAIFGPGTSRMPKR